MLKQLRIRFVAIAMLSMLVITTLVVGTINVVSYINEKRLINNTIEFIALNGGALRRGPRFPENGESYGNRPENNSNGNSGNNEPGNNNAGSDDSGNNNWGDNNNGSGTGEVIPGFDEKYNRMAEKIDMGKETQYTTRFFAAYFTSDGEMQSVNVDSIAAFSEEEAGELAQSIFSTENLGEVYRDGVYFYTIRSYNNGYLLIYMDCSESLKTAHRLLWISLVVAFISLLLEFIIITLLSKRVVKPVVENVERQKRFITDASHELKTPLTIISANTEVLEMMNGEDEWTDSIKNQTVRMTKLVNEMVYLAKMDEERPELTMSNFSLSEAITETAMPFKTVAEAKGFTFSADIAQDVNWTGDEASVRQMLSIFLDNAIKYTTEQGHIEVKFYQKGNHHTLTVANSCAPISKDELAKLFERFYRTDKSRSRETGGSGIGLSIAKAISDAHKNMELTVSSPKEKIIEFKVRFK
ncbi:MAG: HAMP domain-containing histidine kinase [Lachnospiraceae bacterium]|nr:HAMP domain-containing histidine kinase [Lachnospiraceae bacterium]